MYLQCKLFAIASVLKVAMITLQRFFGLDILIAVRTAPGHSYINPPEIINCISNCIASMLLDA